MSDGVAEQVKKFIFKSRSNRPGENDIESLEVFIPEVLRQNLYASFILPLEGIPHATITYVFS